MNGTWAFRVDGNKVIGMGHVMRCLAIADAARLKGYTCIFILSDSCCESFISDRGYTTIVLDSSYNQLVGEVKSLINVLSDNDFRCLVVDSYFADFAYLNEVYAFLKSKKSVMVCLDGLGDFPYPCDVFINYNIYGLEKRSLLLERYNDASFPVPKLLLGSQYIPLRTEFSKAISHSVKAEAKAVLISTGGADHEHLAVCILQEIIK